MDDAIAQAEMMALSGDIPSSSINNPPVIGAQEDLPF
jgi:hypothetical protein